jgi:uncharacterized BrkB/YihY/UPF0761 family membrane protein
MTDTIIMFRGMPKRFIDFYWGQGLANDVPALTYYLTVSLVPFAFGVSVLIALIIGEPSLQTDAIKQIGRYLPPTGQDALEEVIRQTAAQAPLFLSLAVVIMIWTSSAAVGVIERCLARILSRPGQNFVVGKLRNLAVGAGFAFIVVFMVFIAALTSGLLGDIFAQSKVWLPIIQLFSSILMVGFIYKLAPSGGLHWKSALTGSVPAGLVLQIIPLALGLYVSAVSVRSSAGIFLTLSGILFSLWLIAQVLIIGAALAALQEQNLSPPENDK